MSPLVPRDLVTIVNKATERDPGRRYSTAGELSADLQRFLDDEPILARRQSQTERLLRWARRNPGIASLGVALSTVLVAATIASALAAGYFDRLRRREATAATGAQAARQLAEEAADRERAARKLAEEAAERERTARAATGGRCCGRGRAVGATPNVGSCHRSNIAAGRRGLAGKQNTKGCAGRLQAPTDAAPEEYSATGNG